MKEFLAKFKSRKFLLTFLSVVGGIATALTGVNGTVGTIASVVLIIVPVVTYVITEGTIDAKAIQMGAQAVEDIKVAVK